MHLLPDADPLRRRADDHIRDLHQLRQALALLLRPPHCAPAASFLRQRLRRGLLAIGLRPQGALQCAAGESRGPIG